MPDADYFELLRFLAIIIGMAYQSRVLVDRTGELRALGRPDAHPTLVELEVLHWHLERGWLIMSCHIILLVVGFITHSGRSQGPPPSPSIEVTRIVIDLLWTGLVIVLSVISWRANVHYKRILDLLDFERELQDRR